MYSNEEKQFHAMNLKLRVELGELERQIDEMEARRVEIINLLDGNAEIEEEPEVVVTQKGTTRKARVKKSELPSIDDAMLTFLVNNPGSARKEIEAGLTAYAPDVPYQVERAIKRLKRRELIYREGNTRTALWHAVV